jgi:hypothetical protein
MNSPRLLVVVGHYPFKFSTQYAAGLELMVSPFDVNTEMRLQVIPFWN